MGFASHGKKLRAIYLSSYSANEEKIELKDKLLLNHFNNVLKLKVGEKVLILDGKGKKVFCFVSERTKKKITLEKSDEQNFSDQRKITIALGNLKREAFTEALKKSVECNVKKIIIFNSEYSQRQSYKTERIQAVLKSAIEQSNSIFDLEVNFTDLNQIKFNEFNHIYFFNSQTEKSNLLNTQNGEEILIIIGPEGGFSPNEIKYLKSLNNISEIKADTNILRAPTALSYSVGHVQGLLNMRI